MSFAETRQIMADLQEIMALLNTVTIKTERLNTDLPRTKETLVTFRELERLALRYLILARRLGLPEDVTNALTKVSQLIMAVRMLQTAIGMLELSNPYTFALGLANLSLGGLAAYDSIVGAASL